MIMNKILCVGLLALLFLGTIANVQAISDLDQKLIDAAKDGDIAKVKEPIKAGVDVNAKSNGGWTALMHAAEEGNTEIVKLLKSAGAKE